MSDVDKPNELLAGLSEDELFQLIHNMTREEYAERTRQIAEAAKLVGLSVQNWPQFEVVWDLSPQSQHLALDGLPPDEFAVAYPGGLRLERVHFKQLDAHLCAFNLRTPEEVWGVGTDSKAARVLLSWIEGRGVTPPLVGFTNQTSELMLQGGNHRVAVARAKGEVKIPILIAPENYEAVGQLLDFLPAI